MHKINENKIFKYSNWKSYPRNKKVAKRLDNNQFSDIGHISAECLDSNQMPPIHCEL